MFRFSLQHLLVAVAIVAIGIVVWTPSDEPWASLFGSWALLMIAVVWASESLRIGKRLVLSAIAAICAFALFELPLSLLLPLAIDSRVLEVFLLHRGRMACGIAFYFWIGLAVALALSALVTYGRSRPWRKWPVEVLNEEVERGELASEITGHTRRV